MAALVADAPDVDSVDEHDELPLVALFAEAPVHAVVDNVDTGAVHDTHDVDLQPCWCLRYLRLTIQFGKSLADRRFFAL